MGGRQPDGGTLTLETELVELDAEGAEPLEPSRYALLRMSDGGIGMEPEVARQAFEPFFTTKEPGKGTGLGLASVYGVVTQSGGRIRMESVLNSGTSFEIVLPLSDEPALTPEPPRPQETPQGTERILLVEDERVVRELTREMLEQCGYEVIAAARPQEALDLAAHEAVDLLMTDVVMPEMNGTSLAALLRRTRPLLPVLFTSGYTADADVDSETATGRALFLQKPYSTFDLANAVRTVLDRTTGDGPPPADSPSRRLRTLVG